MTGMARISTGAAQTKNYFSDPRHPCHPRFKFICLKNLNTISLQLSDSMTAS